MRLRRSTARERVSRTGRARSGSPPCSETMLAARLDTARRLGSRAGRIRRSTTVACLSADRAGRRRTRLRRSPTCSSRRDGGSRRRSRRRLAPAAPRSARSRAHRGRTRRSAPISATLKWTWPITVPSGRAVERLGPGVVELPEEALDVERQRRHPLADLAFPDLSRPIGVDLDPVAVGIGQVDRLADEVIREARQRHPLARGVSEPACKVGALRDEQREVVEPGVSAGRRRASGSSTSTSSSRSPDAERGSRCSGLQRGRARRSRSVELRTTARGPTTVRCTAPIEVAGAISPCAGPSASSSSGSRGIPLLSK